ncbi:hypothetical protein PV379_48550, partial [Streptomyces caniscabiei]|nr:hypothetical protein [Streptomyces caniscabiei]
MAHTAFGGLVALAWLLLPTATRTAAEGPPRAPHAAERAVVRVMGPPVGAGPATAAPALLAVPAAAGTERTAAPADDSSGSDLILPVAAAGTAVAVAAYSLVRRRRRVRLRTTPTGGYEAPTTPLTDLHHRARRLLVETDDSVRTSTEELGYAAARPGDTDEPPTDQPPSDQPSASKPDTEKSGLDRPDAEQPDADGPHLDRPDVEKPDADESDAAEPPAAGPLGSRAARPFVLDPAQPFAETPAARDAVRPFVEALADARGELVAAFGAGLRLEEESETLSPDEERALLEEILTWCTTAQRRLDTATPAFDQLRALERDITPALECAEARFRELTGRTATAAGTLTALHD